VRAEGLEPEASTLWELPLEPEGGSTQLDDDRTTQAGAHVSSSSSRYAPHAMPRVRATTIVGSSSSDDLTVGCARARPTHAAPSANAKQRETRPRSEEKKQCWIAGAAARAAPAGCRNEWRPLRVPALLKKGPLPCARKNWARPRPYPSSVHRPSFASSLSLSLWGLAARQWLQPAAAVQGGKRARWTVTWREACPLPRGREHSTCTAARPQGGIPVLLKASSIDAHGSCSRAPPESFSLTGDRSGSNIHV